MNLNNRRRKTVSLGRALSKLGYCSRVEATRLILEGHVKVNGTLTLNPAHRCVIDGDKFKIDDTAVGKKHLIYIAMNKPANILTTRADERGRKTVYDFLIGVPEWIFPVGRLDKETTGLLVFTNDNRLGERLTNPMSRIPKTYLVRTDQPLARGDAEAMRKGMRLMGRQLLPAMVENIEGPRFEITISEGKNRQVRRMCEALGYDVLSLKRIRIGGLVLPHLREGEWKYLKPNEVKKLLAKRIDLS